MSKAPLEISKGSPINPLGAAVLEMQKSTMDFQCGSKRPWRPQRMGPVRASRTPWPPWANPRTSPGPLECPEAPLETPRTRERSLRDLLQTPPGPPTNPPRPRHEIKRALLAAFLEHQLKNSLLYKQIHVYLYSVYNDVYIGRKNVKESKSHKT